MGMGTPPLPLGRFCPPGGGRGLGGANEYDRSGGQPKSGGGTPAGASAPISAQAMRSSDHPDAGDEVELGLPYGARWGHHLLLTVLVRSGRGLRRNPFEEGSRFRSTQKLIQDGWVRRSVYLDWHSDSPPCWSAEA